MRHSKHRWVRIFTAMAKKEAHNNPILAADLELVDEPENRRFVVRVDGHRASLEYDRDAERIFLTGINIPLALRRYELSDALVEKVLIHVEEQRWKVIPTHPAIKDYMRTHSAWQRLLLKGIEIR